jgi:hypothetical protein
VRLKIGDEVWVPGITVQGSGTNNTKAYYLPVKARICRIEETEGYHENIKLFHVIKKNKCKTYKTRWSSGDITSFSSNYGYKSDQCSRSWNKIKRYTDLCNKSVRSYKK